MGGALVGRSAAPAVPTVANATAAVAIRSLFMGPPFMRIRGYGQTLPDAAPQYRDLWATLRENRRSDEPQATKCTALLTEPRSWCKLPQKAKNQPNKGGCDGKSDQHLCGSGRVCGPSRRKGSG